MRKLLSFFNSKSENMLLCNEHSDFEKRNISSKGNCDSKENYFNSIYIELMQWKISSEES